MINAPNADQNELEPVGVIDPFRAAYAELLAGSYDSVDRIVLNAYFRSGQIPGGFRNWWRVLTGSDADLDNTHLMRFAGRFSRRVRAYAEREKIPLIYCQAGERKHEIAAQYVPQAPDFVGVFAILVGRAPGVVWEVFHNQAGQIREIRRKTPYPYVNHYHFHVMEPQWGHIIIKLCPHPPFNAQIILKGHQYLARQAQRTELDLTQEGNCFSYVDDPLALAQLAETLSSDEAIGQLHQVCERWIYSSCLAFALSLEDQQRTGLQYDYALYQLEYSRNLLFQRGGQMEQVVQGLIDRIRAQLDVDTLKTIFGLKRRPFRHQGRKPPRCEVVVETPSYDLTVFKVHFGRLTLKFYTKGEHVLRFEVIIHNTRSLPLARSLPKWPAWIAHLRHILDRFLETIHCLDLAFISDDTLDHLPEPSRVGQSRVGGINLDQPRIRAVLEAVIALALKPDGFSVSELAAKVRTLLKLAADAYTPRHAAYDLKKLRAKGWVHKIGRSRRYQVPPDGLRLMAALLTLRDKVIKPVLAGVAKPKRGPQPKHQSRIDALYLAVQRAMLNLFVALGIAT